MPIRPTGLKPWIEISGEVIKVRNNTASTMVPGALVYVTGYNATDGALTVDLADADYMARVALLVVVDGIAAGKVGYAAYEGDISGLNTNGLTVGNPVYLSATAGAWTASAPTNIVLQVVGIVSKVSASVGKIKFSPGRRMLVSQPIGGISGATLSLAELNKLTGLTATTAEMNKLAGLATTAAELAEINGRDVVYTVENTVTLAEVNAGKIIIPAVAGVTLRVQSLYVRPAGNFTTLTSVLLQDTNDTPVVVATLAQAQLTNGANLFSHSTGVTLGAGFYGPLTAAKGLQVIKAGSDGTVATSLFVRVTYTV